MPYIFLVNKTNRHICVQNCLFGVPATDRARSQILNVKKEDELFLYTYGTGYIYGVFKAATDPYEERSPEKGPWNLSPTDRKHRYYPYRILVEIVDYHPSGISLHEIENLHIGISSSLLLRKSVVYISEFQANIIKKLLPRGAAQLDIKPRSQIDFSKLESLYTKAVEVTDSQEKALQLLVQKNFQGLEQGIKSLTSYFNIQYGTVKGEIDILGRDQRNNYIVTELKANNLKKDIWTQLLSYSHVIRDIYAKYEGVDVRSFVVCPGFDTKTFYSYPELKKLLRREDSLRVFQYKTNFIDNIEFEEIPVQL